MAAPAPPAAAPEAPVLDFISDVQRSIVLDPHRIKLVNGCAGSRKTDTIVKLGVHHMVTHGHNLMFLTLVSSITHELRERLEKMLGIQIPRVGSSNHFVGEWRGCAVTIANFDAFVHRQLEELGMGEELRELGDCHDWKTGVLFEAAREGRHTELVMKTGARADFVLVDEFQDMDPVKARILTHVLQRNPRLWGIAVGDMMQSIFPRAVSADLALGHPMNVWRAALHPQVYHVDTCYRCPAAHVSFVTHLLGEHYDRYGVPRMLSCNADWVNRPVLFTHEKMSKNHSAYTIAAQVCAAVRALFRHDATLRPDEVAVIMKKSNSNHVFEQLKTMLEREYAALGHGTAPYIDASGRRRGGGETIVHFETRGDGFHNSIDWARADGKTVLLSIHGDKGKGHRVVFMLGLSHRSVPCENNVFKTEELIDLSLVNVALTRSTQYLFVGFTSECPSRYLALKAEDLGAHAYLAWDAPQWALERPEAAGGGLEFTGAAPPPPYREAVLALRAAWSGQTSAPGLLPNFDREMRTRPLLCPSKDLLRVRDDVAKDMARVFEALFARADMKGETVAFGARVRLRCALQPDMMPLLGMVGELLVYRYLHLHHGSAFLKRTFAGVLSMNHIAYTDDDRILNIVSDTGLNQLVWDGDAWRHTLRQILFVYAGFLDKDEGMRGFFGKLLNGADEPVTILSSVFASVAFRKQLSLFLGRTESARVPTRVFWNMALCFNELCESLRRPSVLLLFNHFNEPIEALHANVDAFCRAHLEPCVASLQVQACHRLMDKETDPHVLEHQYGFVNHEDLDADRYARGYVFGLVGKSDLLDADNGGHVFELKTSGRVDMSREWLAQALLYCCVPCCSPPPAAAMPALPRRFSVVNLLSGTMQAHAAPPGFSPLELVRQVLEGYGFHERMVDALMRKAAASRQHAS